MRVRLQVTRNTLGIELCTDRYAVQFCLCGTLEPFFKHDHNSPKLPTKRTPLLAREGEVCGAFCDYIFWTKICTCHRHDISSICHDMMTSSNGNIFRVTGHLCGEFTGPRWIPTQRPVTRSFDVFFDLCLNKRLRKQSWGWRFETLLRPLWRNCNDIPICDGITL